MTDPRTRCQILWLPALLAPVAAVAGVIDSVNSVRRHGCGPHPASVAPLRESERLDQVARQLSQGVQLRQAQLLADYHSVSSFSVRISNVPPGGDVAHIIGQQFCQQSTNPAFHEFGSWQRGGEVWLAFAEPFSPPKAREHGLISRRVLELANQARARARRCGSVPFAAAPPLTANATLEHAAAQYARELADYGFMSHTGHDGSSPAQRITRSGYRWREVGENLASGIMTADAVVAGWLQSPEHCANLMDPAFRQMGVAYAVNPHNEAGVYWALEFGTPR
jgi:uncharacterized protein YkwD